MNTPGTTRRREPAAGKCRSRRCQPAVFRRYPGSATGLRRRLEFRGDSTAGLRWSAADLRQAFSDGPNGGLGAIADRQFSQDILHMFLDGLDADIERVGDFLVR